MCIPIYSMCCLSVQGEEIIHLGPNSTKYPLECFSLAESLIIQSIVGASSALVWTRVCSRPPSVCTLDSLSCEEFIRVCVFVFMCVFCVVQQRSWPKSGPNPSCDDLCTLTNYLWCKQKEWTWVNVRTDLPSYRNPSGYSCLSWCRDLARWLYPKTKAWRKFNTNVPQ